MHPWNEPLLDFVRQRQARLPHALLLHGPRGVGKLALAERMAQLLLCEAASGTRPCDACQACRWYLAGNHPDFRRLEPPALARKPVVEEGEGEEAPKDTSKGKPSIWIRVDEVRQLDDFFYVVSHRAGRRVVIVHPAETLYPNAANSLLKILEEPPPAVVFILVSHRPTLLLPTIRSRCVALPARVPEGGVAAAWLAGQGVKDAARWLAFAGGAPLRAVEYAADAEAIERALRSPEAVNDREDVAPLLDVLQRNALDRAFAAFGLPPKYATLAKGTPPGDGARWLAYARELGANRPLVQHPLTPKLFTGALLAARPPK